MGGRIISRVKVSMKPAMQSAAAVALMPLLFFAVTHNINVTNRHATPSVAIDHI